MLNTITAIIRGYTPLVGLRQRVIIPARKSSIPVSLLPFAFEPRITDLPVGSFRCVLAYFCGYLATLTAVNITFSCLATDCSRCEFLKCPDNLNELAPSTRNMLAVAFKGKPAMLNFGGSQ